MAMTNLTKRNLIDIDNENINYPSIDALMIWGRTSHLKPIQSNKASFNSKATRFSSPEQSQPGPGAYNASDTIGKPHHLHKNYHSKSPRLVVFNDLNTNPGPGAYNIIHQLKPRGDRKMKPESNIRQKYMRNIWCKQSFITSLKAGMIEDNDDHPEKISKGNKAIDWSKVSIKNTMEYCGNTSLEEIKVKTKEEQDYERNKRWKIEPNGKEFIMKGVNKVRLKDDYMNQIKALFERDEQLHKKKLLDKKHKSLIPQGKEESYQSFGSSSQRNINGYNSITKDITPGPGEYLPLSFLKLIKYKRIIVPQSNITRNKSMYNIGPGSYDHHIPFTKASYSNVSNFSSIEKRFVYPKMTNEEPLPKNAISNRSSPIFSSFPKTKSPTAIKDPHLIKANYHSPTNHIISQDTNHNCHQRNIPMPHYYNSIDYKINHHCYKGANNYQPPFISSALRFNQFNQSESLQTIDQSSNNMPICHSSNPETVPFRSQLPQNHSLLSNRTSLNDPGPSSYQQDSYFNWNKKSYNKRYI